jgi:hypothetical protein
MRRLARMLKRHFGPTAPHVSVRVEIPWYWRFFWAVFLLCAGFSIGFWRYAREGTSDLRDEIERLDQENKVLRTQAIHVERQQQVTTVAQGDLAKDLTVLQEENVRLKEDVTFYKSILEESAGVAVVKLHSFKVTRGEKPGEYRYRLLLIQSGKHDKNVQGSLQLALLGTQEGRPVTQALSGGTNSQRGGKINFKYYQPLEGSFTVPGHMSAESLQAKFFQAGSAEPKLTQVVSLIN